MVRLHNARLLDPPPTLQSHGFQLVEHEAPPLGGGGAVITPRPLPAVLYLGIAVNDLWSMAVE